MNKALVCSLLLLLGALVHTEARAQMNFLRGLESLAMEGLEWLDVEVDDLREAAQDCNVNKSSIEASVITTLDGSRIITQRSGADGDSFLKGGILGITVTTLKINNNLCASSVMVRVWRLVNAIDKTIMPIVFTGGGLLSGPPASHGAAVNNASEIATRVSLFPGLPGPTSKPNNSPRRASWWKLLVLCLWNGLGLTQEERPRYHRLEGVSPASSRPLPRELAASRQTLIKGRRAMRILITVVLALGLAACGSDSPTAPSSVTYRGVGSQTVEIQWPAGSGVVTATVQSNGSVVLRALAFDGRELNSAGGGWSPPYDVSLFVPGAAYYLRTTNVASQTAWTITLRRGQ